MKLTIVYTLQQNGMAERKNSTFLEIASCILIQGRIPFGILTGKKPDMFYSRTFICKTFTLN